MKLLGLQTVMNLMAIAGIRNRDIAIAAAVAIVVIGLLVLVFRRRRSSGLDLHKLDLEQGQRYAAEFGAIEREFVDHPEQAAAHAKGLVEEVMRRMGFPDRIDGQQRVKDVAGYDREAATSLEAADKALREGSQDTELLRRVLQSYRDLLHRLLQLPHPA